MGTSVGPWTMGLTPVLTRRISHLSLSAADPSREGRNRDNSWLQFNWFIHISEAPANALKPRILTYINYSSTVSHNIFTSPCFCNELGEVTVRITQEITDTIR